MRRIYLDQNKWLDLARAANGRDDGAPYAEALNACRRAVASGTATFPLDVNRWNETWRRRDVASRQRLAAVMIELSQRNTICRGDLILTHEIDSALHDLCGRPATVEPLQVHGTGLSHMMGGAVAPPQMPTPDDVELTDQQLASATSHFEALFEAELFAGEAVEDESTEISDLRRLFEEVDERYADYEESVADQLKASGFTKGPRLRAALGMENLGAILSRLVARIDRAGLDVEVFMDMHVLPDPGPFLSRLPTSEAASALRVAKHAQGQQRWTRSDFSDLLGLPVAVVHCDVVVTERQWVDYFTRARLGQRHDTVLLSDTAGLVEILET